MNPKKIEQKWQKLWMNHNIFNSEPDNKPKFFVTFPYPYINGLPHVGHLFTIMKVEALARYKRLQGHNVLFPQGWHATGSPIITAAKRIEENEEKQWQIMRDMKIPESEIPKFAQPEYWIKYFPKEYKKDLQSLGLSIDWRREFHTTSLNPYYDKFIRWQFQKLKDKNYIIKGKFPVVWCPKENTAVGDHSRKEGEGETPQEFCLFKFELEPDKFIITATLRPDTVWGITNVYVNPNVTYKEIEVNKEIWIVAEPVIPKLKDQEFKVTTKGNIKGKDLIGKKVKSFGDKEILVLPATFLDPHYGTGMVHSVPSDSADDLIALRDLQKDEKTIKKYNLDPKEIKAIQPIEIFNTPKIGGNSAQYFLDKYKVKSQDQRKQLEEIKKELYKLTFTTSTYGPLYKKGFSKNLQGMSIPDGQEIIKKELLKQNKIALFYELTGKVVCRCLTTCTIKIVEDQWFLNYADEKWKKLTHKCLNQLKLYPEKSRQQFDHVIDWLHEWACTRESGLGTRLPWDEKWLIESLSDSTLYMSYYTITHLLTKEKVENIDNNLFDYIFFNKDTKIKISKEKADKMRKQFQYWYPCDFRNSGKDLIQNHLTFYMFNHTAIFPEKYWPKGIGVNGWVTVDGQKMSKSLGNMIPVREMVKKYSADSCRLTILSGGESMDDPNWDTELAKTLLTKFTQLKEFVTKYYNKGRSDITSTDAAMQSKLHKTIKEITENMELTNFRTAIQKIFFEINRHLKWYTRKTNDNPNKQIINDTIESQLIMLSPFTPHLCEELWEHIGNKPFITLAEWPKYNLDKIDPVSEYKETLAEDTITDIKKVLELIKIKQPKTITIIVSPKWKYTFYLEFKKLTVTTRDVKQLIQAFMQTDLKRQGNHITKMIPALLKDPSKIPLIILDQTTELDTLTANKELLEKEFNCEIQIEIAESSKHAKANNASPSKPAILIE